MPSDSSPETEDGGVCCCVAVSLSHDKPEDECEEVDELCECVRR